MAIVDTRHGKIEGVEEEGLSVFRGIPYARPPVGTLRFRPPEAPEDWQDVLRADAFGPVAPQLQSELAPGLTDDMSEDCLSLNVWTPGCDKGRRPVMVWIHGGSFLVGASRNEVSDGSRLARRGDVVVVSINYRVGAFGFLHLADFGESDFAGSGNIGLLDQAAALKWVRDNIEAFGGDPDCVTVFGCSAGGISISALMTMPAARGLFHRAITQSGASLARSAASASTAANTLMEHAGVRDVEGLRALSVDALLAAQHAALAACPKPDVFFGPVVDEAVLPEPPQHAIAGGRAANVPLLSGTTLDEMRYWLLHNPVVVTVPPDKMLHVLRRLVGDRAEDLLAGHRAQRPNAEDAEITVAVLGDLNFTMPAIRMAEAHALHVPDTWMYLFAWQSPAEEGKLGAPHAIEQPFVFGTLDSPFSRVFLGPDCRETDLSDNVQDAWIAFARNGSPEHAGIPEWPAYDPGRRAVMHIDREFAVADDPLGDTRQHWDGVPFDGISPPVGVRPVPQ